MTPDIDNLGPASKALLDFVNSSFGGFVDLGTIISYAQHRSGISHSKDWWYRRLVALAIEGYIDVKVYRTGDDVALLFRRKGGDE